MAGMGWNDVDDPIPNIPCRLSPEQRAGISQRIAGGGTGKRLCRQSYIIGNEPGIEPIA
jgi:hypothetical protein